MSTFTITFFMSKQAEVRAAAHGTCSFLKFFDPVGEQVTITCVVVGMVFHQALFLLLMFEQLDASDQWRGPLPSSVWTRHRAVKQGQSGGLRWQPTEGKEGCADRPGWESKGTTR